MAFFKFRARGNEGRASASAAGMPQAESVEAMRRRARHRLLGAAVLVLVGVIGFPLLFDTQPRPVAVDIPIEIPDRNAAKPLPLPAAAPAVAPSAAASAAASRAAMATSPGGMITEAADGSEIPPSKSAVTAKPAPETPDAEAKPAEVKLSEVKPDTRTERKSEVKPERKPENRAEAKPPSAAASRPAPAKPANRDDAARALALLEGKGATTEVADAKPAATEGGRFVVQVGAFADAEKAREMRQKLEKAGLKTYTHVTKTPEGERIRVRVGPFASRADADKAAGRIKGLALPAAILSL